MRDSAPTALQDAALPATEASQPILVLETPAGKAAFLARAEKQLPEGEALVEARGLVGRRRAFRTVPRDPRAQLVAVEPPLVLRGGLTALVSYYRVPVDALEAEERHYEDGRLSHVYDVVLKVARLGRRKAAAAVTA